MIARRAVSAKSVVSVCGKLIDYVPIRIEVTYILKYAEENGRSHGRPWSIRQSVAYHQAAADGTQTWVLLHPLRNSVFQARVEALLRQEYGPQKLRNPYNVHVLHLASYVENWKRYIAHLNRDLSSAVSTIQPYGLAQALTMKRPISL